MENITHLDKEVELRAFNKPNLKDLWQIEQDMRTSLKEYNKSTADSKDLIIPYKDDDTNDDMVKQLKKWKTNHYKASEKLQSDATILAQKLQDTVVQSEHDKKLASMNISGLQNLVQQLNEERDLIVAGVSELNTAQGLDENLKIEYRSEYYHYIVFFIVMIIVVWLLTRIHMSQESSAAELVILIVSVLVLIYHFYNWIWTVADDFWDWLNGLFNF